MAIVPFDTLKMAQKLRAAGLSVEQSEGLVEALAELLIERSFAANKVRVVCGDKYSIGSETNDDIFYKIKADIFLIKWMTTVVLVLEVVLIVKVFAH